jgi:hypothetical protein
MSNLYTHPQIIIQNSEIYLNLEHRILVDSPEFHDAVIAGSINICSIKSPAILDPSKVKKVKKCGHICDNGLCCECNDGRKLRYINGVSLHRDPVYIDGKGNINTYKFACTNYCGSCFDRITIHMNITKKF